MIRIYTTPSCPQCMATKRWLDKRGITYQTVDLTDPANMADYDAIKALGYTAAPIVAVGQGYETSWSGFQPDRLEEHCITEDAA